MLQVSGMQVSGVQVSGVQVSSWPLQFIRHKYIMRSSTLKIDGWVCNTFRAHKTRAATCGAEQWALNIFTPQLHTCQNSYIRSRTVSGVNISVPHSNSHHLYTYKHMIRPYLHMQCARHDAGYVFLVLCVQWVWGRTAFRLLSMRHWEKTGPEILSCQYIRQKEWQ